LAAKFVDAMGEMRAVILENVLLREGRGASQK
jgi:hypothetical protein